MGKFIYIGIFIALLPQASAGSSKNLEISPKDLAKLSAPMKKKLAGLQYLLNPYQIKQFVEIESDSSRERWLEVFWKANDPTPVTEENEMKREHAIRVRLARRFFPIPKWPGWDKRGEIFIRYGLPSYRGKVWGEVTHMGMYPPREIWYYSKINMLVAFENFGLKGEYMFALDPLGTAETLSPDLMEFLLYDTDESLSSRIPDNYLERSYEHSANKGSTAEFPPKLPENMDALMDPDRPEMTPKETAGIFMKDKLREAAINFEVVLEKNPSFYPFNFSKQRLPCYFGIDQFKAGEYLNRIEVNLEVPLNSSGEQSEEEFVFSAVVLSAGFKQLAKSRRIIRVAKGALKSSTKLIPSQLVFSLNPGYYRIGISVEEKKTGRSASFRTSTSVDDFTGELSLSDILFAQKITRAEKPSIFTRGALEVVPHPLHAYRKSFSIPIYFEIYNLRLDDENKTLYSVEYRIIPHSSKKKHIWDRYEREQAIVSSRFVGKGYSQDEIYHVFIRTENLPQGSFDFLVKVKDEIAQAVAYRRASFSIID